MESKKIKLFLKLYWIRILLFTGLSALGISLIFLVINGIRAWNEAESYLRQSQLAMIPLQLYLQLIMAMIFGVVYTFMWYWLMFKRGAQSFSQTSKKSIAGEELGITWNDVIGMDEAKQEALEFVKLIKDRADLQRIGGKILKGILMLGPPGCGKTYLAKAIATEARMPFISMSGSEFVEMFVGVGAGRIRSLFKRARQLAESEGGCIIFIDEVDAVGAQRSVDRGFGGQTETNTTLNQLLVEMDGLKEKDVNVVIIGATNMPENYLDAALLRPGRFDRKIYVDVPGLEDRERLFAYYLQKIKYDEKDLKLDRLAKISVGYTPADISNIIREAALIAVRYKKELVSMKEIEEARERIALGIKRRIKMNPQEKLLTAYHEAGHAIVTYLLAPTKDVFKASIIPRKGTGGATWIPEKEESFIKDQNRLLSEIKISLGSYVAEKIKFGYTSAGVDSDFQFALVIAHNMVWRWGMGKSGLIGNFYGLMPSRGWQQQPLMSEETKTTLDRDIQEILNSCLKEIQNLLNQEMPLLDRFSQELVKKEELNYDEIEAIFKEFGKARST
ncbi:MAG: AAA family ATPase [Candidatus Omnitrophota bacterium]